MLKSWQLFTVKKLISIFNKNTSCKKCVALMSNLSNVSNVNSRVSSAVTGKLNSWLQLYENVVGLAEVREAQEKVIQVCVTLKKTV